MYLILTRLYLTICSLPSFHLLPASFFFSFISLHSQFIFTFLSHFYAFQSHLTLPLYFSSHLLHSFHYPHLSVTSLIRFTLIPLTITLCSLHTFLLTSLLTLVNSFYHYFIFLFFTLTHFTLFPWLDPTHLSHSSFFVLIHFNLAHFIHFFLSLIHSCLFP